MQRQRPVLVLFFLLVFAASSFGAWFQPGDWYAALRKPPFTPPNWMFPVVWTALYVCIALAGWLVWRETRAWLPLVLWGVQLGMNAAWSWLFFGLNLPAIALVEILALLGVIVATTVMFFRVRPLAGWLMVPYAAWVGLASYLNAGLWWLNRTAGS